MLTEYEAQKLAADMRDELEARPSVLAKYAVAAVLFLGLAVAGIFVSPQRDGAGQAGDPASEATKFAERTSIMESRRLTEERRARFDTRSGAEMLPGSQAAQGSASQDVANR